MEPDKPESPQTPASYADFEKDSQGTWLKTLVQFFAIPFLIVCVAVGIYVGINLMVGTGPQSAADFVEILSSDTINRRTQAAFELSLRLSDEEIPPEFRDPRLIEALGRTLREAREAGDDPPTLAQYVLTIFARLEAPESAVYVREALADEDDWIRSYAVLTLASIRDTESLPEIRKLVGDPDPQTRAAALRACASLEQVPGIPYTLSSQTREIALEQLRDPHEDVRFNSALLLARAGEINAALPTLKKMLDRGYLETFEFHDRLGGTDRYRIHSEVMLSAIRAIIRSPAALSDPDVIKALRKLADDESEADQLVRAEAHRALAGIEQQNNGSSTQRCQISRRHPASRRARGFSTRCARPRSGSRSSGTGTPTPSATVRWRCSPTLSLIHI